MSKRLVRWELGDESVFGIEFTPTDTSPASTDAGLGGQFIGNIFLVSDNMKAIRAYFARTTAVTPAAAAIKDKFIAWFDGLSWYSQSDYDLARNQRNLFDQANAVTPLEKAQAIGVQKTGLSTEQLVGQTDTRLESGLHAGPTTPPKPDIIPLEWKIAGAVVLGIAVIVAAHGAGEGVAKKIL